MAYVFEWTDDLSVGVEIINNQHKELFKRVNSLLQAMNEGKGEDEIKEIIGFLEEYVVVHFGTEEDFMTRYNYPDYPFHKGEHEAFKKDFVELKRDYEIHGVTLTLIIEIQQRVCDWLINHIGKVDKMFGRFLIKKL